MSSCLEIFSRMAEGYRIMLDPKGDPVLTQRPCQNATIDQD
jgi:hypothetical protein